LRLGAGNTRANEAGEHCAEASIKMTREEIHFLKSLHNSFERGDGIEV
jgi:hypothetical protein